MKRLSGIRHLLLAAATAGLVGPAQAADPGITDSEITIGLFAPMSGHLPRSASMRCRPPRCGTRRPTRRAASTAARSRSWSRTTSAVPNEVVAVVKKFVTVDKIFIVHGGSCTAAAVAAQEFVTREKVPHVMLNASGDGAVIPPTRYVFGAFGGTQRTVGATLAEFAVKELKGKRLALVAHDDDYGKANVATIRAVAARLGAQVVAAELISPRVTDVTAPMLNIRAANPDVIISTAYPAAGRADRAEVRRIRHDEDSLRAGDPGHSGAGRLRQECRQRRGVRQLLLRLAAQRSHQRAEAAEMDRPLQAVLSRPHAERVHDLWPSLRDGGDARAREGRPQRDARKLHRRAGDGGLRQ